MDEPHEAGHLGSLLSRVTALEHRHWGGLWVMVRAGWRHRAGRSAATLVAAIGLLAACGGSSGTDVASKGGGVDNPTSTTEAVASGGGWVASSASPEGTTKPAANGSSSASAAGSTTMAAPVPDDTPGLPAAGGYRYHTTGSSKVGANPSQPVDTDTTTTIEHLGGGKVRQSSEDQKALLEWSGSQVLLHSLDFTRPGFERHFEAKPPVQYAPVPLKVGQQWAWKLTATSYPTTIDQTSRVDRLETIMVGGKKVDTIVIVTKLTLSGDVSGTIDLTQWASTTTNILQRIHAVSNIVTFTFTSDTTSDLTGFTPA